MVRYESRMQWRSGNWKVLAFGYFIMAVAITFFMVNASNSTEGAYPFSRANLVDQYRYIYHYDQSVQTETTELAGVARVADWLPEGAEAVTDGQIHQVAATIIIVQAMGIGLMFMMVALPIMMSDAVPLDHKLNMLDLLKSCPLLLWVYLGGKVINVWLNTFKLAVVGLLLICGIALVTTGWFDPAVIVIKMFAGNLVLMLFAGTVAVLVPSLVASRRAALMVGILMIPFILIAFVDGIMTLDDMVGIINPLYRFSSLMQNPHLLSGELLTRILSAYAVGGVILLVVAVFTWSIQRLQRWR
jgi:hypothetical protein